VKIKTAKTTEELISWHKKSGTYSKL